MFGAGMRKAASASQCALVSATGPDEGTLYAIGMSTTVVGRSIEAALRLDCLSISRFHARLTRAADGQVIVRDLGSENGTFVNGDRVRSEKRLHDGDRLSFGPNTEFKVRYRGSKVSHDTGEVDAELVTGGLTALLAARNHARMHLASHQYDAAAPLLENVLKGLQDHSSVPPEDFGEIATDLGRCRAEQGREFEAIGLFEQAVKVLEGARGVQRSLARARFLLGQTVYSTDARRAVSLVGAAAECLESSDPLSVEIVRWLESHAADD